MTLRRCPWLAVLLPIASACNGPDHPTRGGCGSVQESIYGGTDDAGIDVTGAARAAIVRVESLGGVTLCTATILSSRWALTAAHCLVESELRLMVPATGPGIVVRSFVMHPDLDAMLIEYGTMSDPAMPHLALFKGPLDDSWVGERVTLAGYGRTEDGGLGELHFTNEAIARVNDSEVAVDGAGMSGACEGDSGGPLLGRRGAPTVLGVLSRGSGTCRGVDVYARADVILPWVEEHASLDGCVP